MTKPTWLLNLQENRPLNDDYIISCFLNRKRDEIILKIKDTNLKEELDTLKLNLNFLDIEIEKIDLPYR